MQDSLEIIKNFRELQQRENWKKKVFTVFHKRTSPFSICLPKHWNQILALQKQGMSSDQI